MVLAAEDGSVAHAVTTVGGWLFDSNLDVAQKTTEPILDWCCNGKFSHVHCAARLVPLKLHNGLPIKQCGSNSTSGSIHCCLASFLWHLGCEQLSNVFSAIETVADCVKPKQCLHNVFHAIQNSNHDSLLTGCKILKVKTVNKASLMLAIDDGKFAMMVLRDKHLKRWTSVLIVHDLVFQAGKSSTCMLEDIDFNQLIPITKHVVSLAPDKAEAFTNKTRSMAMIGDFRSTTSL